MANSGTIAGVMFNWHDHAREKKAEREAWENATGRKCSSIKDVLDMNDDLHPRFQTIQNPANPAKPTQERIRSYAPFKLHDASAEME